jgi:hypothetical protein
MFNDLFEVSQTGNRIDIIHIDARPDIRAKTVAWWQSHGWEVVLWNNQGYNLPTGQNRILEDWRASDREMLVMAHDDITLYPNRYLTQQWLNKPLKDKRAYTLNSNMQVYHQHLNSQGWDDGNHHWTPTDQTCKMFVITDKSVPRFDESMNHGGEDLEWSWACFKQGIRTYRLETVFLREQSMRDRDTWEFKAKQRKEYYNMAFNYMFEKYSVSKKSEFRKAYEICP